MIQCIRSSSWTGYMLMKVRHDLPEVGFVKVPAMMEAASGCLLMDPLSTSWSLDKAKLVSACSGM